MYFNAVERPELFGSLHVTLFIIESASDLEATLPHEQHKIGWHPFIKDDLIRVVGLQLQD
jgi:hypothetical protein